MHQIENVKDTDIILHAKGAIEFQQEVSLDYAIANTDRSVGAMLSGEIAKRYGNAGLPDHTLNIKFKGSAGQSFGAFLAHGVHFRLEGEANDYLGKGLSGGRISLMPPVRSTFVAEDNTIAGNTLLYGATSGGSLHQWPCRRTFLCTEQRSYCRCGRCRRPLLRIYDRRPRRRARPDGANFAAGMSGGVAYVWNKAGDFDYYCNMEMVELSPDRRQCHPQGAA